MDVKFHKDLFDKSVTKIDILSVVNLQRGVMYDLMAESIENDLRSIGQKAGVKSLKLISPNLSRLIGFVSEAHNKREIILDILKGNKQLDDFIGEEIFEALADAL